MIRILAADSQTLFLTGLCLLLKSQRDFVVVGVASDGSETLALTAKLIPDILLIDPFGPHMSGTEALRELQQRDCPVKTIILTNELWKDDMLECLEQGTRGFVLKDAQPELLYKSVRCVMKGEYWVGRESVADLMPLLCRRKRQSDTTPAHRYGLTPREFEILMSVVKGFSNKQIASRCGISSHTVKHHLTSIFNKVGVGNRLELLVFALGCGLLPHNKNTKSESSAPSFRGSLAAPLPH